MLPIIFQLFGCRDEGVGKPVDEEVVFDSQTFTGEPGTWYESNAMPLIAVSEIEHLNDRMNRFENEEAKVNFDIGSVVNLNITDATESATIQQYSLSYSSSDRQEVYAITTSYLHYLKDGRSYINILDGAIPNSGDEILALKTIPSITDRWKQYHPEKSSLLQEYAYINIEIDFDDLLNHISKSTKISFHKKIYEQKKGEPWTGDSENWPSAYLDLFKEYADVPIVVQGGAKIGYTTSSAPSEQQLAVYFKIGDQWAGNESSLKDFFNYHQRQFGLAGHPLIADLRGLSVKLSTVDIIPNSQDISDGSLIVRQKHKLLQDFAEMATETNPEYHPLAIDPDQVPEARLVVPRPPEGTLPAYLESSLESYSWSTKLKISNPLAQSISIDGYDANEVSITLLTADNALEPIYEISYLSLPNDVVERTIQIKANGNLVYDLKLAFFEFKSFAVKFYRLSDKDPTTQDVLHEAEIDETKLNEVIAYANKILGRQSNVFMYPIEEENLTLHEFLFDGNLGNPILEGSSDTKGVVDIYDAFATTMPQLETIKVVFVWDENVMNSRGLTYAPNNNSWLIIFIDTLVYAAMRDEFPPTPKPASELAKILVHELGHWFSITFPLLKENKAPCSGGHQHFSHSNHAPFAVAGGCSEGDWGFYGNIMNADDNSVFITGDQAQVYNNNADDVVAEPEEQIQ